MQITCFKNGFIQVFHNIYVDLFYKTELDP